MNSTWTQLSGNERRKCCRSSRVLLQRECCQRTRPWDICQQLTNAELQDLSDGADEEFDFALQVVPPAQNIQNAEFKWCKVYAPVLFRSPSSFSLWAALARNEELNLRNFYIHIVWYYDPCRRYYLYVMEPLVVVLYQYGSGSITSKSKSNSDGASWTLGHQDQLVISAQNPPKFGHYGGLPYFLLLFCWQPSVIKSYEALHTLSTFFITYLSNFNQFYQVFIKLFRSGKAASPCFINCPGWRWPAANFGRNWRWVEAWTNCGTQVCWIE